MDNLLPDNPLNRAALIGVGILLLWNLLAALLLLLFDLAHPILPSLSYPNALGLSGLFLLVVATVVGLKEA